MAALCSIRPLLRSCWRSHSTISSANKNIVVLNKAIPAEGDQCKPPRTLEKQCVLPFPAVQRNYHTSSQHIARFQRPLPVTPDDVDWSKLDSLNSPYKNSFDADLVGSLLDKVQNNMPVSDMPNPFEKNYRRCSLCRHDVYLDHKNVRLLSQFVSPYTGRIYGRAITGLCIPMQKRVSLLIKRARMSGYMPFMFKDPKYLHDPQPYDVMSRKS
ncbi:hypothetical protein EGW08_020575 [Elysia chlorotica]|uniref:28S ribosomal protein S18c, mitochondrial n=1 Tax=Elysia chlorotica TaxID=188477 RepID=A0A433SQZ0_ELYCH|nr:hypothetical protein EGW08_020575 [Elysia chlorotica]